MSVFEELKRRNVFRVAAAYLIVGWLILQVGEVLAPALRLPDWTTSAVVYFLILGFPVAMIFAWAFELTPDGLKRQAEVDRERSITRATGRALNGWIIGLLAIALGIAAFDRFVLAPDRNAAEIEQAVRDARDAQPESPDSAEVTGPSIAVLPFVNMSSDPDQEYFSDGISEEMLNVLARYPGVRVAARSSSFQFKDENLNVMEVARELGVSHVLEGSVRKAGERIRITAQLIEASSGYQLWSDSYDRELRDVFAIQDEISAAIGEALQITLALGGAAPQVPEAASVSAYETFLAGRQLVNQRGRANLERAVVLLESTVAKDPDYAPAQAQLAIALMLLSNVAGAYGDWPFPEAKARAQPHLERALMLDDTLAEVHGAQALAALLEPDYAATKRHAERAIEINPSYADAISWLSLAAVNLGHYDEAMAALERSLVLDPLSVTGRANLAMTRSRTGQIEAGISLAEQVGEISLIAKYLIRGAIAHDNQADLVSALGWFMKLHDGNPGSSFASRYLAYIFGELGLMAEALRLREDMWFHAYASNGDWQAAVAELQALLEANPDDKQRRLHLASALLFSGNTTEARAQFERLLAAEDGLTLRDPFWYSAYPTMHAAWLRRLDGDEAGAEALMTLARLDLEAHIAAGRQISWNDRSAALLAAMEGNDAAALQHMEAAFLRGHRDLSLFNEPALVRLSQEPAFLDLERRMTEDLAKQRVEVLQLICQGNSAEDAWSPLPETCAEVP